MSITVDTLSQLSKIVANATISYNRHDKQCFVLSEKIINDSCREGLMEFDAVQNCHKLTEKGLVHVCFAGVRKDCEIFIDRRY